jgi:hypothetical protein
MSLTPYAEKWVTRIQALNGLGDPGVRIQALFEKVSGSHSGTKWFG